ncbi:hypothetical protein [Geoalkalibacter halelectricus]|uniref:hypothetical protein n=1 Tax=Geoalkalibacter halelectricus TaxID=2847045 RepID=UPI003D26241E
MRYKNSGIVGVLKKLPGRKIRGSRTICEIIPSEEIKAQGSGKLNRFAFCKDRAGPEGSARIFIPFSTLPSAVYASSQ